MPPSNKRNATEAFDGEVVEGEDSLDIIARLEVEVKKLNSEVADLKSKLATYEDEEESDVEGDDEPVCDGSTWSVKYHLLKAHKQQKGTLSVSQTGKDRFLGIWVRDQRVNYKKKKLSQDRIDKLEAIGFHWGKGFPVPKTWDDMFQELAQYKKTFGHCNVPINDDPALRTPLAKWVAKQRMQGKRFRKQMPSEMTVEQYERLNDLSFLWRLRKKQK